MQSNAQIDEPQKQDPGNGRVQLPGESALWYRRYCLYRDLGHKRSLKAAVKQERKNIRLIKTPEPEPAAKGRGRKSTSAPAPAPEPEVLQVPGSWKAASKVYQWVERARAFDAWLLNRATRMTLEHIGDTFANKYKRVSMLNSLLSNVLDQLNHASSNGTTHKNYLAYVKTALDLSAQIEREMKNIDKETLEAHVQAYVKGIWEDVEKGYQSGASHVVKTK